MPLSLRILTIVIVMGCSWGSSHAQCDVLGGPSVPLYWDANGEPNIDFYNVYRSQNSGSGYSVIGTAAQGPDPISFTESTPLPTGFYVVTAVNTSGLESGFSDSAPRVPRLIGVSVSSWAVPSLTGSVKTRTVTSPALKEGFHR